jgi:hypothetical protein
MRNGNQWGLNGETHGGNRGLQDGRNGSGRRLISERQSTTVAAGRQELLGTNGRVCATIDGDCLKKQIDGSRHFLQKPGGIAFDASILDAAERAGVRSVWVRDRETGDTFTCQFTDLGLHGVKIDRGFGPQVCLPFTFWRVRRAGAPVQLTLFGAGA